MKTAVALGSNLGDRLANLREARRCIRALRDVRPPFRASSIYETAPVECEAGAAKFLNAVVEFDYGGSAAELLAQLRSIEAQLGRPAAHGRNSSRTIDLDILYFGNARTTDAKLQLPHPRIATRRFVLAPLAELRPNLVLPGEAKSVRALLDALPNSAAVVRLDTQW